MKCRRSRKRKPAKDDESQDFDKGNRVHGPRIIPHYATPEAIMEWYKEHPDSAKGVDLDKLKAELEADLVEQIRNGSVKLAPKEQKS